MDKKVRKSTNIRVVSLDPNVVIPFDSNLEIMIIHHISSGSREIMKKAMRSIEVDYFYNPMVRFIVSKMKSLDEAGETVDILNINKRLSNDADSGPEYKTFFVVNVIAGVEVKYISDPKLMELILYLKELYLRRSLMANASELHNDAANLSLDIFELIYKYKMLLHKQESLAITTPDAQNLYSMIDEYIAEMDLPFEAIQTGYTQLDEVIMGFEKTNLIIIAARPGMGKTAFILCLARNIVKNSKKVPVIFSLEMSKKELINRLVAIETKIPAIAIKTRKVTRDQKLKIVEALTNYSDLMIDDTPGLTILELKRKIIRAMEMGAEIVFIDYLQLMRSALSDNASREQVISEITRSLKTMAKELKIPIIALSQLSRTVESRADKRPMLSDLRESGSIEQDADSVIFLFRPEYYGYEQNEKGEDLAGKAEVIIAKHRSGSCGTIYLKWIASLTEFVNEQDDELNFNQQPIF